MNDYRRALDATKSAYPFQRWAESDLPQYTPQACEAVAHVFDRLIDELDALGPAADEAAKLAAFKKAVVTLNAMNEEDDGLIETGEREDLCELVNAIATAAGLDPAQYGDGEGPASEWREW